MSQTLPVLLAALALGAAAQPASSAPADRVTTVRAVVPVADLDLRRDADVDTLLKRVEHAADRACTSQPAIGLLALQIERDHHACKAHAVAATIAQLEIPRVRARYAQLHKPRTLRLARR